MKDFEVWVHIQNQQMRFFYSLTTLSFTILGLSVQFSPQYGNQCPYLLVFSWFVLVISGFVGGWRLLMIPNLHRLDFESRDTQKYLKDVEKIENWPGPVIGTPPSVENVNLAKQNIEKSELYKKKQQKSVEWTYYVQIYGFILGIFLNLLFVTINYLN